jgi:hypothetical protein
MSESKEIQKEGTTRERTRSSIGQHTALTRQELIDRWLEVAMAMTPRRNMLDVCGQCKVSKKRLWPCKWGKI